MHDQIAFYYVLATRRALPEPRRGAPDSELRLPRRPRRTRRRVR